MLCLIAILHARSPISPHFAPHNESRCPFNLIFLTKFFVIQLHRYVHRPCILHFQQIIDPLRQQDRLPVAMDETISFRSNKLSWESKFAKIKMRRERRDVPYKSAGPILDNELQEFRSSAVWGLFCKFQVPHLNISTWVLKALLMQREGLQRVLQWCFRDLAESTTVGSGRPRGTGFRPECSSMIPFYDW